LRNVAAADDHALHSASERQHGPTSGPDSQIESSDRTDDVGPVSVRAGKAAAKESRSGVLLTLQRGLRLLEAITFEQGHATAKVLSEKSGIRLRTTYHMLTTLMEEGYVTRFDGGRYGIGPRLVFLLENTRTGMTPGPELIALLRDLHARSNETSYVTGWYGRDLVLQQHIESGQAVTVRGLEVGYRDNPHARSACKAILSAFSEDQVRAFFAARSTPSLTAHTITDIEALLAELASIAERGYAIDREEFAVGVCCVGAAFYDQSSFPVGSFAVSVPAARFDERLGELAAAVVDAAQAASRRLGYTDSFPVQLPLRNDVAALR
jgi:IclR family transcriptional regulator, acetate operon repressor